MALNGDIPKPRIETFAGTSPSAAKQEEVEANAMDNTPVNRIRFETIMQHYLLRERGS